MSTTIYWDEMDSPIGPLVLAATDDGLCHVDFGRFADQSAPLTAWAKRYRGPAEWSNAPTQLHIAEARRQLGEFFAGERQAFELPLDLWGTDFQKKVWKALTEVPFGQVCSYKDIAEAIGQPKAVRAVGGANNRNPIPVIVPCHRIIGASGALVGYGGGLPIKTYLLQLEGRRP
ncbi:O-6-methylguanine DNA methyltransferase [Paenibacillus phyllosphaerae]|uniref:Methylated-DNA--protein-cysteine methyltransferase n=1 Tax=Paenibacillus phyllosphaerae TaxID=274593 RepID=A0A7W5FPP9_9BACL|nr:methylated-DNA--[protein]-cysteine S-methyltransferase [Paenibacillus phyllosphaerae]MBB3112616.1 O-6-methylguanine DNA methyltransferase [Paenibacillus phyllosphaerae]